HVFVRPVRSCACFLHRIPIEIEHAHRLVPSRSGPRTCKWRDPARQFRRVPINDLLVDLVALPSSRNDVTDQLVCDPVHERLLLRKLLASVGHFPNPDQISTLSLLDIVFYVSLVLLAVAFERRAALSELVSLPLYRVR